MKRRFSRDRLKFKKELALGLDTLGEAGSENDLIFPLTSSSEAGEVDLARFEQEDSSGGNEMLSGADSLGLEEEGELGADDTVAAGGIFSLTIDPGENGQRLDVVLTARFPDFSRSQLAKVAKEGLILMGGKPVKASAPAVRGQVVTFPTPKSISSELEPAPQVQLDIVYEDDEILVVNKPAGLMVHPAPSLSGPTLAGGLLAYLPQLAEVGEPFRPGLVHRLDKDTSGILIAAKTAQSLEGLSELFSRRETLKNYLAFVRGRPRNRRGVIDSPIGRHNTQRHKMAAGESINARPARTIYRVLKFFPKMGISLILLTLVTGRTHQARVHLQSLGTPVLADPVYSRGVADLVKQFPELKPFLTRQMLHARRLTITHPVSGQRQTFRAPWPLDFLELWRILNR